MVLDIKWYTYYITYWLITLYDCFCNITNIASDMAIICEDRKWRKISS